ncbi:hypothetical protein H0H81_011782 [Sphagnurus paluster]|uniref:Uncharacterized protein n=1 Tax=Sphagnurus paluster TaxID=117069 RepID=A0A9P7FQ84_9AGAR|nr:hypothetical protein H0H81_011782 [Sphagnurus paluster]
MLANDSTATATFTFLGVAIYFSSPLWPYPVTSLVSLDSGIPILLDLQDHNSTPVANGMGAATVNAKVSWGVTGLNNTNHTLVVSVGPSKPYAVLDTLITPGLTSTAKLVISLSSILGSLVFALTAFAIWFLALRRRTPHHDPYDPGPPAPNFRFSWGSGPRAI